MVLWVLDDDRLSSVFIRFGGQSYGVMQLVSCRILFKLSQHNNGWFGPVRALFSMNQDPFFITEGQCCFVWAFLFGPTVLLDFYCIESFVDPKKPKIPLLSGLSGFVHIPYIFI